MPSTGNVFAGTGETTDRAGATVWTTPENIVSDNATDATVVGGSSGSDYLHARNFAFSAVPDGVDILGVFVRAEVSEHTAGTEALHAQLQDDTGALFGTEKTGAVEGNISGTAKAIYTWGSASDLWGASLTPAIVKDVDFGVRFWFLTAHDIRIDFVTMDVTWADPLWGITQSRATWRSHGGGSSALQF